MPRLQEGAVKAADQLARDAAEIPWHEWRAPVPADIVEGARKTPSWPRTISSERSSKRKLNHCPGSRASDSRPAQIQARRQMASPSAAIQSRLWNIAESNVRGAPPGHKLSSGGDLASCGRVGGKAVTPS